MEWGNGAINDMGAHLIDHAFWALDLGYPTTVETVCTPRRAGAKLHYDGEAMRVTNEQAANDFLTRE